MKFTAPIVALLSATALAAPAEDIEARQASGVSMMRAGQETTITNMKRVCANGVCNWSFGILPAGGQNTACSFKVRGSPATETDSTGNVCGKYTVSTGWSDQFGADKGFTTLSVVDNNQQTIIYPAYTDKQLKTNKVVKPDQSYTQQSLPS